MKYSHPTGNIQREDIDPGTLHVLQIAVSIERKVFRSVGGKASRLNSPDVARATFR